ncbi:hypothetical protein ABMA27_009186 [Loxostege sticticalis]|uniref:Protein CASC3 n=1 Tax=Loxostege sticticalis TaxID=481309 RepID=A0ABR3HAL2_LOXSC
MTSVVRRRDHDDSGEYSDASQDIEQNNSGNDGGQPESDYDSQGSDTERSDQDPESQETERRVDDDEDRSNPQYIPKRGTFYEHDDRTAASGEESNNTTSETASEKKEGSETPAERRRPPRKSEIINKWSHDKYNENEQMPKSRDELVAIYGYDIRNEDAPPHARRNRRYGRGPNKYTRTWEDEEAYKRQTAAQAAPRKPPNPEEFPDLATTGNKYSKKGRAPRPRSKSQPASNESLDNGTQLRRNASIKTPKGKTERAVRPTRENLGKSAVKPSPKPAPKDNKMPAIENLTITTSVVNNNQGPQRRVNAAVAQQRPVPTEQGRKKPPSPPQQQQPQQPNNVAPNKSPPQQPPQQKPQPQQQQNQQQNATGAEARGGSKRYSSLRQRPLAENYTPQQQQQQAQQQPQQQQPQQQQQQQQQQIRYAEYPAGGGTGAPAHQPSPGAHPLPQQIMHQVHRSGPVTQAAHGPSPPHQPLPQPQHAQQQVRLGMLEQQQLVQHPHAQHLHNMPQPHTMGQLQPTQGYAPPAMMPAQYMQQPAVGGANSGVYSGAAMFAQPPAPYPLYPPPPHTVHNYATQAGGVTYYNCAEQEPPAPVQRTHRRPTAAIPIVRPQAPDRPVNSSEKDNIDRIVENMFVRKPWPATHGADSKDKTTDNRSSQEPQSKESSQPNSLTSSSISTDSRPSEQKEERTEEQEERKQEAPVEVEREAQESIPGDA